MKMLGALSVALLATISLLTSAAAAGPAPADGPEQVQYTYQKTLSPNFQVVCAGVCYATYHLDWSDYPFFNQQFTIFLGDGGSNTYTCYSNCTNGGTDWHWNFSNGEYFQFVRDSQGLDSNTVQTVVSGR